MRLAAVALLALAAMMGCGDGEQAKSPAAPAPVAGEKTNPAGRGESPPKAGEGVPHAIDWDARLAQVDESLAAEDLENARTALAEITSASEALSTAQLEKLASLEAAADSFAAEQSTMRRDEMLIAAGRKIEQGDLDGAQADTDGVLNLGPTESQRTAAAGLLAKIEATRAARRRLAADFLLLESENRGDFNTARGSLLREPDVALPLVIEGAASENRVLAGNCLRLLRWFKRPDQTVPVLVAVLANESQKPSWPTAVEEIARLDDPGAGQPLLDLALRTEDAEQRSAALTALSQAPDPPPQTLTELLPVVYSAEVGGPDLSAALRAARRAATLHGQTDVTARRGFSSELRDELQQGLSALPSRLEEIAAVDTTDGNLGETGRAATSLAVSLRLIPARTLANIKLTRSGGEDSASPAAAVLDGEWRTIDPAQMWRHPRDGRPLIAFDLGGEFTITGVRIWNYNEPNQAGRGWREIDVFAGPDPALLNPISRGVVPPAPGIPDAADYSVTLPVPFVFGRYVKLEPKTYWNPNDSVGGVTEIEIVGF